MLGLVYYGLSIVLWFCRVFVPFQPLSCKNYEHFNTYVNVNILNKTRSRYGQAGRGGHSKTLLLFEI